MNGYNRCGGYKAPMMYAMPAVQQPVQVKTEMVKVPEPCEATQQQVTPVQVPACAPMPMACPMPLVAPVPTPACGPMQYESCCRVVEPTVCCTPEVHHHHRVEHVVPVVVRNVHHHHNHHDYVICKQEGVETHQYDHGLRNEDWCALAMQQDPCGPKTPMC